MSQRPAKQCQLGPMTVSRLPRDVGCWHGARRRAEVGSEGQAEPAGHRTQVGIQVSVLSPGGDEGQIRQSMRWGQAPGAASERRASTASVSRTDTWDLSWGQNVCKPQSVRGVWDLSPAYIPACLPLAHPAAASPGGFMVTFSHCAPHISKVHPLPLCTVQGPTHVFR